MKSIKRQGRSCGLRCWEEKGTFPPWGFASVREMLDKSSGASWLGGWIPRDSTLMGPQSGPKLLRARND